MAEVIIMPKLGFNMNEGKLVQWYKNEGDGSGSCRRKETGSSP